MSWRTGAGIRCSPGPYQEAIKHLVGRPVCVCVWVREKGGQSFQTILDLLVGLHPIKEVFPYGGSGLLPAVGTH